MGGWVIPNPGQLCTNNTCTDDLCCKACYHKDFDYGGNDIACEPGTASAEVCQARCRTYPQCVGFTYLTDLFADTDRRTMCCLKHTLSSLTGLDGVVSGPREGC